MMKRIKKLIGRYGGSVFGIALVGICILYAILSIIRHMHYESGAYDLGIFDQTVWQYSRFMVPFSTLKERLILGDHLNLTLPFLSVLYWIWADARMLLVFQAAWFVFSAFGIYRIGLHRGASKFVSMGIALVYVLFYGIQQAVIFDFHASIIGVGLVVWTAYFLESKQNRFMWACVALLLLTQENMGIALAGLGCIYMADNRKRTIAVIWIILGILYTLIATRIVGMLSPVGFEYAPELPHSPYLFLMQLFDHTDKRDVWFKSLGWFAFLPLFSPGAMAAMVMDLSQYFLSGPNFVRNWTTLTHHRAMLAPFLALGAYDVVLFIKRADIRSVIVSCMLLFVVVMQYVWHMPLNKLIKPAFWREEQWMRDTNILLFKIPSAHPLAAQHNIVPHVSERKEIYVAWPRAHVATDPRCVPLRTNDTRDCWWLDMPASVEYLVVDTRPYQWLTQILETDEHFKEAVANMEVRRVITLVQSIGTVRLYKVDSTIVVNK